MFRSAVTILLAFALSACALNIKRPVSEDDLGKTKRVGVVSILGDSFQGIHIGTTVFNNEYFSAPVPEWNIDKYATAAALQLLRSNPRFESAEVDRGTLSAEQIRADKGKALWEAAEAQHFDRLVIVRPGVSENFKFFKPSFGLLERSIFALSHRCIYAAYIVDVYDVAKREPIAWEWGGGMPCRFGSDDDLRFKEHFTDYSPGEQDEMRKRLDAYLSSSLRYSLTKLSLVPAESTAK